MTKIIKTEKGYKMGTTKIIKVPEGWKLEGDPVDLDVDKVDGKHASDLKHGIATDDETAIKVKVGSFTCPAVTGNYSVTGVGFKPRYVEFKIIAYLVNQIYAGLGWMDYNGNQNDICWASIDDEQVGNYDLGTCIYICNTALTSLIRATYISMNNDGFTINFTYPNTAFKIMWKAVR